MTFNEPPLKLTHEAIEGEKMISWNWILGFCDFDWELYWNSLLLHLRIHLLHVVIYFTHPSESSRRGELKITFENHHPPQLNCEWLLCWFILFWVQSFIATSSRTAPPPPLPSPVRIRLTATDGILDCWIIIIPRRYLFLLFPHHWTTNLPPLSSWPGERSFTLVARWAALLLQKNTSWLYRKRTGNGDRYILGKLAKNNMMKKGEEQSRWRRNIATEEQFNRRSSDDDNELLLCSSFSQQSNHNGLVVGLVIG